ncbi:hypothetical protein LU293_07310 [Moraxella nasovis]|uniref:hypothetical protein n=1 Tax=Moraxella nasovis TaxID=2904121 RepID=UPI001F61B000|nr:hypothetical protein [Moraxella nasovis]UNU72895.1 hypothetical protein LU293_07310 [Moraxella nasovis]
MILDSPPQIAQIFAHIAHHQSVSVEQFVLNSAYEKALQFTYTPNDETRQAIDELTSGKGVKFDTLDELMADLA